MVDYRSGSEIFDFPRGNVIDLVFANRAIVAARLVRLLVVGTLWWSVQVVQVKVGSAGLW